MLLFVTGAVILAVAYSALREGLLTAITTLANVVLAGLATFNLYELLADQVEDALQGTFLQGYEDALSMVTIFCLVLAVLRVVTNNLAPEELEMHALLQQIGSVAVALVTGYLVAGFLVCVMQTLPWGEKFLGFEPTADRQAPPIRQVLPPDRVWLAMMHRAGRGPLSQADSTTFDPEGSFELRYARLRRWKEQ